MIPESNKLFLEFSRQVISTKSTHKWTDQRIRNPRPSWADLEGRRVGRPEKPFKKVIQKLQSENMSILVGEKDAGKTWLCYLVAHHYVRYHEASVMFCAVDDRFSSEEAFLEVRQSGILEARREKTLVILDDCHLNPDETQEFVSRLGDDVSDRTKFLYSMRRIGTHVLRDVGEVDVFKHLGREKECIVDLSRHRDGGEFLSVILKRFVETSGITYEVTEDDVAHLYRICGGDLFFLRLMLDYWRDSGRPITQLDRSCIFDSLWSAHDDVELKDPKRREIFSSVAHFCQFEPLMVTTEFVQRRIDDYDTLRAICHSGLLSSKSTRGVDFLGLSDTLSDLVLSTIESKAGFKRGRAAMTADILGEYLLTYPPNWLFVFSSLGFSIRRGSKEGRSLARAVFDKLVADTAVIESVSVLVARGHPREAQYLINILRAQKVDEALLQRMWSSFTGSNDPARTANQLLEKTRTLSTANAFLIVAERMSPEYAADVVENMVAHPDSVMKLVGASSGALKIRFQLRFGKMSDQLNQLLLGTDNALAYLSREIKQGTATKIRHILDMGSKSRINIRRPLVECAVDDWVAIVARSTLNGVRLLIYSLMQWRALDAARNISRALCVSDLQLLVNREDSSVRRLNGLVGNVVQVDALIASHLVEALAQVSIRELLLREDVEDDPVYSKASQISAFVATVGDLRPEYISQIVEALTDEEWLGIARTASIEDAMWLVWSVYKGNKTRARSLLEMGGADLLENDIDKQPLDLRLPIAGVIVLGQERKASAAFDFLESAEIVKNLVLEGKNVRLVLTLVALKAMLPKEQCATIMALVPPEFRAQRAESGHFVDGLLVDIMDQRQLW